MCCFSALKGHGEGHEKIAKTMRQNVSCQKPMACRVASFSQNTTIFVNGSNFAQFLY